LLSVARTKSNRDSDPVPTHQSNPVLLGEAGIGKSAIVERLAQEIAAGKIPELLRDRRVISSI